MHAYHQVRYAHPAFSASLFQSCINLGTIPTNLLKFEYLNSQSGASHHNCLSD